MSFSTNTFFGGVEFRENFRLSSWGTHLLGYGFGRIFRPQVFWDTDSDGFDG